MRTLTRVASGFALAAISYTAAADSATGTIVKHHLNGGISDRGVCIQLSPAISGAGSGWACLYKSNALYKEISGHLLAAYFSQKPVTVSWNSLDSRGDAVIQIVE